MFTLKLNAKPAGVNVLASPVRAVVADSPGRAFRLHPAITALSWPELSGRAALRPALGRVWTIQGLHGRPAFVCGLWEGCHHTPGCLCTIVSPKFEQAKELPLLDLIPEGQLISVLFQEAVPAARGRPCQTTRTNQLDGASQTEAVRNDQTVIMFQPCTAVSVGHWSKRKSPCVETPEVCCCEQEGSASLASLWGCSRAWPWPPLSVCGSSSPDRHTEGHQTSPETLSPAHDQQERGRILKSMPPGHPLGEQGWHHGRLRPLRLGVDGPKDAPCAGVLTMLGGPGHAALQTVSVHNLEPHVSALQCSCTECFSLIYL